MRQRQYRARVWLNENEYTQFIINVEKTGLSKETYLRQLIMGYKPRELPPMDYYHFEQKITEMVQKISVESLSKSKNNKEIRILYQQIVNLLLDLQKTI